MNNLFLANPVFLSKIKVVVVDEVKINFENTLKIMLELFFLQHIILITTNLIYILHTCCVCTNNLHSNQLEWIQDKITQKGKKKRYKLTVTTTAQYNFNQQHYRNTDMKYAMVFRVSTKLLIRKQKGFCFERHSTLKNLAK